MAVTRLSDYDTWVAGAQGSTVNVYKANTTTLASIFSDEALTVALANPQTLLDSTVNGVRAGKWAQNVYVNEAVEVETVGRDKTAIIRPPLTTLVAQDASKADAKPIGGDTLVDLDILFSNLAIHVENLFGPLSATDTASNTTKLQAAIGIASANNGGFVVIPDGTFPFSTLSVPKGVVVTGQGVDATTIKSQTAGTVVTLSGDRSGLRRLTLDGVDRQTGSVGIFSKANDELVFDDVVAKRFDTGIHCKGGRRCEWTSFSLTNNNTGGKLHGDNDAGGGADGDEWSFNRWQGGLVDQNINVGLELSYEDKPCFHNAIKGVGFESNTAIAVKINGARYTSFAESHWSGNTTDFDIDDDSDTTVLDNTVIGLHVSNCRISGGILLFKGTCQDVVFEKTQLAGSPTMTLTNVLNNILCLDCIEETASIGGNDAVRWIRLRSILEGASAGVTTDATATKAWSMELAPGQVVYAEARVVANGTNDIQRAVYHIAHGAYRLGSTLAYDAQSANFTLGDTVTGGTSGATAIIIADSDSGATGTLTLREISGVFENNETITDVAGGSALVNGTLVHTGVVLDSVGLTSLRGAYEVTGAYACIFVANGIELEVHVTGAAGDNVDWVVNVSVTT